jgi:hypothetical protein
MTLTLDDTGAPQWNASPDDDVGCPLCSYNLRGLVTPHCPECGYTFTWPGLLESRRSGHPYLFEHHPERNVFSFVRTLAGGLFPRRFWRKLTPLHVIRPRRLALYWVLACLPALLAILMVFGTYVWGVYDVGRYARANYIASVATAKQSEIDAIVAQYGSVTNAARQLIPSRLDFDLFQQFMRHEYGMILSSMCYFAWPWMIALMLTVYRRTSRQASIRPAQILRCAIYSADVGAWFSVAALATIVYLIVSALLASRVSYLDYTAPAAFIGMHFVMLVGTYRLVTAYSLYLKLRRAWLAVPLASIAVALLDWVVLINVESFLQRNFFYY